jgi:signal transduction histidine kinase
VAPVIAFVFGRRLYRTSSFRLTLLCAGLFSASALVLLGGIFWSTSFYMTGQLDAAVESDVFELLDGFRTSGIPGVAALIQGRVDNMPSGPMFYMLENREGKVLAGNLPALPRQSGTFDIGSRGGEGYSSSLRARGTELADGYYLLVAIDAHQRDEMREDIVRAFGWSALVTLVLAIGGGVFLSNRLLRRVEAISRTAREIMDGHLSQRVPTSGTDDEFAQLATSLNAMLARSETTMRAMRQISNDIAHDLRTPLARLRQRLELTRRKGATTADLHAAIDASIADTDAILATFGALLRIAQIESRAVTAGFGEVDLSELLRTVVEVYQPMAEENGQDLSAAIACGLKTFGDPELLAQMFANVLENALRHSPEHAVVRLGARCEHEDVMVEVSDNGPGIPAEEHANVFRRFYRLETSRTTPGNGLGLSLVGAIADLHGIAIRFDDNCPGLKVTVTVPPAASRTGSPPRKADTVWRETIWL